MGYLENLQSSIADHQRIVDAGLPEAAEAQQIINQFQAEIQRVQESADTGVNSASAVQDQADRAAAARDQAQRDFETAREAARLKYEQDQTIAQVKAIFNTYGLSSLYTKIEEYVRKGYSADTVALVLRETPEYNQRFPAMKALSAKNRAITESQYIEYESTAAGLERRYGLPQGMLMGNVTKLLENEVSPDELNSRVLLASSAAIQAPQDIKDTLQRYYSVGSGGLTAYFLDPAVATPLLEKQYAAAQIGAEAMRQNIGIDVGVAETLQGLGISTEEARQGFGVVARQTPEFTSGRGDVTTQKTLIDASLGGSEAARQEVERVGGSRVARFQGGSGFGPGEKGAVGLGSAATR